jgi:hypothetical protein
METVEFLPLDFFKSLNYSFSMYNSFMKKGIHKQANKHATRRRVYTQPRIVRLGGLVSDTLPGGSKSSEGGSGKGFFSDL